MPNITNEQVDIDAELRDLFPTIDRESDESFEHMIVDAGGPRETIKIWYDEDEDKWFVIDGHRRLKVCRKHKLPCRFEQMTFTNRDEVIAWMRREQIDRRNLSAIDRRVIRAQLVKQRVDAEVSKSASIGSPLPKSQTEIVREVAEEHGVSQRTVDRDLQFSRYVAKIEPDIAQWMLDNNMSLYDFELMAAKQSGEQRAVFDESNFETLALSKALRTTSMDYVQSKSLGGAGKRATPASMTCRDQFMTVGRLEDSQLILGLVRELEILLGRLTTTVGNIQPFLRGEEPYRDMTYHIHRLGERVESWSKESKYKHEQFAEKEAKVKALADKKAFGRIAKEVLKDARRHS